MNINKLEHYSFLLKMANNIGKKSLVRKMLIELLENEIENEQEIPLRQLRTLIYANAKGVEINNVQEKTPQKYKAEDLQQELNNIIDEQQVSRSYFANLGVKPIICENSTEGNQPKEFWIELQEYKQEIKSQLESGIANADSEIILDNVQSNNLDIIYQQTNFSDIKISRRAKFFFDKNGKLILRSPKGITFMLYLMAGYMFNWLILFSSVLLFILYMYAKSLWLIYLSFIYIVVLVVFTYSAYKNKYKRLHSLVPRRIIKAPEFLMHIDQYNADLELNRPTDFNIAKITEYYATCPICRSKILIDYGDETYKYYMVGRCRNAPDAHVYSFDRVTLKGYFLGHDGYLRENNLKN